MDAKDKIIEDLQQLVAQLTAEIADLKLALAKATKDSSTSSKPPSSDITKPKTSKKPGRRGKPKRGGQPGHQQHLRDNLPPERVDETFDYEITDEDVQRLDLKPTDEFETHQFIELPESPVFLTEHRLRVYLTADGDRYVPDVGDILNKPIFGPRLLAMIGWMKSGAHCRYSTIETSMEDVLQVPVSRGYLLEELVGAEFTGYLNFVYFSANCSFAWNFWIKAQYCWAHLIRDIRFMKKLPDKVTKVWAEQLEDRSRRLFQA